MIGGSWRPENSRARSAHREEREREVVYENEINIYEELSSIRNVPLNERDECRRVSAGKHAKSRTPVIEYIEYTYRYRCTTTQTRAPIIGIVDPRTAGPRRPFFARSLLRLSHGSPIPVFERSFNATCVCVCVDGNVRPVRNWRRQFLSRDTSRYAETRKGTTREKHSVERGMEWK